MMIAGFTMAGAGSTALALGAVLYKLATSVVYEVDCFGSPCASPPARGTTGPITAMALGGALFAVGLPLGIYGSTSKPADRIGKWAPEVTLGPTAARAHWIF